MAFTPQCSLGGARQFNFWEEGEGKGTKNIVWEAAAYVTVDIVIY